MLPKSINNINNQFNSRHNNLRPQSSGINRSGNSGVGNNPNLNNNNNINNSYMTRTNPKQSMNGGILAIAGNSSNNAKLSGTHNAYASQ